MIRSLIRRMLTRAERDLGESCDWLRFVLDRSLPAFLKCGKMASVASARRRCPPAPYHVACALASMREDCGPCVRIALRAAKKDGVPDEVMRAVVERRPEDLPPELAAVDRFASSVLAADGLEAEGREAIRARWGDAALIEIAIGLGAAPFFPIAKRALGYAVSCSASPPLVR